ncbi:MAG: hypothetical protein ACJAQT_003897 [Akkermansiaceae bacterium]|jgi:hypothetical protein
MIMTLDQRLDLIMAAAEEFIPFTGPFTRRDLETTFLQQASAPTAKLPKTIVHIISGNTPHAAFQSLLNGLLLGAKNLLKLPSQALLNFQIPPTLAPLIAISRTLPDHWIAEADALVVFGSDATLRHFQQLCPLETPFIGHGHRVGIALIADPSPAAAHLAARDIGLFDQQGCLSLQTIYLKDPLTFGPLLATAMANFEKSDPRSPLTPSQAGAISNLREETRYLIAQDPKKNALWQSPSSTAWTIIYQDSPSLTLSPGNRTVFLRPLTSKLSHPKFLSGIALHPYTDRHDLPSPRIFPLGQAQTPPALWAHDGILPLASLIKHQTRNRP